ncbi:MATE family efflux transporter [Mangrovitalea sediminis]|uniref:MATE family efflux transporter n=1 Tax=Mangrovitalea sediminis TaxID=1982043 RepID=UPI001D0D22F8|nr:MATE family efflux transporter [Mangrovitalea sediminis]
MPNSQQSSGWLSAFCHAPGALDKRLWSLAWPLMLTNITVPLLGLVDTAVLGHLSQPDYLAAVAVGANLFSVLYWAFGFMRMGTTGLVAQARGRGDGAAVNRLLLQSLLLGLAIGLLIILLQWPLIHIGLHLMQASPAVTVLATDYADIRIWSAPAVLCQYTVVGWLIGVQYPRGPMLVMIAANGLNMLLDITFVTGLGWNSSGVALATLLAEYLATGLGLWLVWRQRPRDEPIAFERLWHWRDYADILHVNRYLLVRTLCLLLTFAFFTAQGARQGDTIVAANAVLLTFLMLISNGLDGFANGAEALVGEAVGRRDKALFKAVCVTALRWALLAAVLFSLVFLIGGHLIIAGLTDIPAVLTTAGDYLPWVWILPLAAVWSYLLDGIFIGAVQTRAMQNTMLASVFLIFLPAWWLTRPFGNHGLWFALTLFMLSRGLTLGWGFRRLSRPWRWF